MIYDYDTFQQGGFSVDVWIWSLTLPKLPLFFSFDLFFVSVVMEWSGVVAGLLGGWMAGWGVVAFETSVEERVLVKYVSKNTQIHFGVLFSQIILRFWFLLVDLRSRLVRA
jgi:hypothetical protein